MIGLLHSKLVECERRQCERFADASQCGAQLEWGVEFTPWPAVEPPCGRPAHSDARWGRAGKPGPL